MSLRTPLGTVLGLGSAKDGTRHFWGQRLSGMGLVILGLWFVVSLLAMPGFSYADAVEFIGAPLNGVMLLLLVLTTAYHSTLGLQTVIEDYVHGHGAKLASLIVSRFVHVFFAVAAVYAIVKVGLG